MSGKRIYRDRLYVVALPQGISGFRQPSIPALVTGASLKANGYADWNSHDGRFIVSGVKVWRVNDGRLPEFQPRMSFDEAAAYLKVNPYSYMVAA